MTIYIYELHGERHDGLRLPNTGLHEAIALPLDIPINNPADYVKWTPTEGQRVGIYAFRDPARPDESGRMIHHLHLHHTEVLAKAPDQ